VSSTPQVLAAGRGVVARAQPPAWPRRLHGSELAWAGWMIPVNPAAPQNSTVAWRIGNGWVKYLAFEHNPPISFTLNDLAFDRPTFQRVRQLTDLYDAIDPDLSAFRRAGGKLILWHGWADQAIPPTGTVAYYQAIQDRMGGLTATQQFARLFMFPGVPHRGGGTAPNTFDLLTPLMNWVENGTRSHQSHRQPNHQRQPIFQERFHPEVRRLKSEISTETPNIQHWTPNVQ